MGSSAFLNKTCLPDNILVYYIHVSCLLGMENMDCGSFILLMLQMNVNHNWVKIHPIL